VRTRLLENKDKLLRNSFDWILTNPEYIKWRNQDDVGLLWIKGDAGKGKTMMAMGLVEELSRRLQSSTMLCYFFCQNADDELNTATAIVKGLISRLIIQKGALMRHLRRRWDTAKGTFTEDTNSLQTLWNIFLEILSDPGHEKVYVVVDALDECDATQMSHLLRLIVRTGLHSPSRIKWLLTSRPLDGAECLLQLGPDQLKVSLELNSTHVSMAVRNYIRFKVDELSNLQGYSRARRAEVESILTRKAEDTFLWVSLVSKSLEDVPEAEAVASIQKLPPGLQPLYDRMMRQIRTGNPETVAMCEQILGTITLAYRPLHMEELGHIAGLPEDLCDDLRSVGHLVDQCASFLTVRKNIVYFVHQSAKDYMTVCRGQEILTSRQDYGHDQVSSRCLNTMSKLLKINISGLSTPSSKVSDVPLEQRQALAAQLEYACCYWMQHLAMVEKTTLAETALADHGKVDQFLRQMLLQWLEALSLIGRISEGAQLLKLLRAIIDVSAKTLRHVMFAS
jgi:NACHT domain